MNWNQQVTDVETADEPLAKLYLRKLIEGFESIVPLDTQIIEFLKARFYDAANQISIWETNTSFTFDGKDKQAIYTELGKTLAKTFQQYPGMIRGNLFAKLQVGHMPPKDISVAPIPGLNTSDTIIHDTSTKYIRYSILILEAVEDKADLGVVLRIGFNYDAMIIKGYYKGES